MMPSMPNSTPAFSRPATPASKCFHLMRLQQQTTRGELVAATGLSQPTVTRAVTALIKAGLVIERNDLTHSKGRGRPTIPLELAGLDWVHAGIAVGTTTTYIGLYDPHGRTVREVDVDTPMAELGADDFIEHVMAGLNRLSAGLDRPLVSVGVTFPGRVSDDGVVDAPSLGWNGIDVAARLRFQFSVPVTVTAAVPAILGSELQLAETDFGAPAPTVMTLFADDSVGAAVSGEDRITQLELPAAAVADLGTAGVLRASGTGATRLRELVDAPDPAIRDLLNNRARCLGELTAQLTVEHRPSTVVVAGSAFIDDPAAPKLYAQSVRTSLPGDVQVELRMIPSHRDIVRAIARAVALDLLSREPLQLAQG